MQRTGIGNSNLYFKIYIRFVRQKLISTLCSLILSSNDVNRNILWCTHYNTRYLCMYVSMYMMHVCVYACIWSMYVCMHVYEACTVCMKYEAYMYVCMYTSYMYACIHHICMHVCRYCCMHVYMYMRYACMYVYNCSMHTWWDDQLINQF